MWAHVVLSAHGCAEQGFLTASAGPTEMSSQKPGGCPHLVLKYHKVLKTSPLKLAGRMMYLQLMIANSLCDQSMFDVHAISRDVRSSFNISS